MVLQPPHLAEVIELRIARRVEHRVRGPLETAVGQGEEHSVAPVLLLVHGDAVQAQSWRDGPGIGNREARHGDVGVELAPARLRERDVAEPALVMVLDVVKEAVDRCDGGQPLDRASDVGPVLPLEAPHEVLDVERQTARSPHRDGVLVRPSYQPYAPRKQGRVGKLGPCRGHGHEPLRNAVAYREKLHAPPSASQHLACQEADPVVRKRCTSNDRDRTEVRSSESTRAS